MSRLFGPQECELATKHCQEISRILKEIDTCLRNQPALSPVSIKQILEALFPFEVAGGIDPELLCQELSCDLTPLVVALHGFCEKVLLDPKLQLEVRSGGSSSEMVFSLFASGVNTPAEPSSSGLSSLTEIAVCLFNRGLLEACLADVVLAAQGIRFDAELVGQKIHLNFYFPVCRSSQ